MTNNLQKARKLLSALSFMLCGLLVNSSFTTDRTSKDPGSQDANKFEKVTVKGSGMDSIKLAEIPKAIQQFVSERKIAGAVTLVVHNGMIVSFEAIGFQDIDKKTQMQKNTIFRIESMTKPFVGAAIMMLLEEGKLQLDDPIEKYLPGYNNMWLVSEMTDKKAILIRPARKVTIRDILTHTHGLAAIPAGIPINSIAEYSTVVSQLPLQYEPGSQWKYGGSGITAAARIVELLSGKPYEVFLSERIFTPLGMKNTSFFVKNENIDKVSTLYQPSPVSGLEAVKAPNWSDYPHPDGGLFSTATDIAKWMQTILNKGTFNGTRILSEESVNELTKIQTGDLETGFTEGMSYGLAFGVVHKPTGVTEMLSPGTFGHGGAFGTQEWADPKTKTVYILMIQRMSFGNGDASDIRNSFQKLAAGAIVK
jgi:CubicO group peptidase (beta-lactamase class C family)